MRSWRTPTSSTCERRMRAASTVCWIVQVGADAASAVRASCMPTRRAALFPLQGRARHHTRASQPAVTKPSGDSARPRGKSLWSCQLALFADACATVHAHGPPLVRPTRMGEVRGRGYGAYATVDMAVSTRRTCKSSDATSSWSGRLAPRKKKDPPRRDRGLASPLAPTRARLARAQACVSRVRGQLDEPTHAAGLGRLGVDRHNQLGQLTRFHGVDLARLVPWSRRRRQRAHTSAADFVLPRHVRGCSLQGGECAHAPRRRYRQRVASDAHATTSMPAQVPAA